MAKLDLIPDLETLVIQGAMFAAAAVIVKTKFVTPYLKLRDKKESLTVGGKKTAEAILKDCDLKAEKIEKEITAAIRIAQESRKKSKEETTLNQQKIIKAAEKEAKAKIKEITSEIEKSYKAEMEKLPSIVSKLTDDFYELSVN